MTTELKMPALSPTMEEGTLAKWLVKEGDGVKSGDILAEIETDKATMEFEAVDEGTIAKILVPEGTDGVKVGQPIALLAGDGEQIPSPQRGEGEGQGVPPSPEAQGPSPQPSPNTGEGAKVPTPSDQKTEGTPAPSRMETAARELVADAANTRDEAEMPEG